MGCSTNNHSRRAHRGSGLPAGGSGIGGLGVGTGYGGSGGVGTGTGSFGTGMPPPPPAGTCRGACTQVNVGSGTPHGFDPAANPSDRVSVDPSGALVLNQAAGASRSLIWIANTEENTVSKVDTRSFQELGRYRVGTSDPSRTAVDFRSDVYVGNRKGSSITKISAAGDGCPDTNADGRITTSTGADDILPYGQDDCVLWDVSIGMGNDVRGLAVDTQVLQLGPDTGFAIENSLWVGGMHKKLYKFDADSGQLLFETDAPVGVYGLALAANGQLYVGNNGMEFGRVDIRRCLDAQSCMPPVCSQACRPNRCPTTCDAAVKARYDTSHATSNGSEDAGKNYGITVDFKQRVWLGGIPIKRMDPSAAPSQRMSFVRMGQNPPQTHGIAADAHGFVWGAAGSRVIRVDMESLAHRELKGLDSKGMAVDVDGQIWVISRNSSVAHVIRPGPTLQQETILQDAVTGLVRPYTYSDMTGVQTQLAAGAPGFYRQVFYGCPSGATRWVSLSWSSETPGHTYARFRVRTGNDPHELAVAPWAHLSPQAPADLLTALSQPGQVPGGLLEVEITLGDAAPDPHNPVTPRVHSISLEFSCDIVLQ